MGNKHSMYTCSQCGGKTYKKIIRGGTGESNTINIEVIYLTSSKLDELYSSLHNTLDTLDRNSTLLNYLNYLYYTFLKLKLMSQGSNNTQLTYYGYNPDKIYDGIVTSSNIVDIY